MSTHHDPHAVPASNADVTLALIEASSNLGALEVELKALKELVSRIKWIMGVHGMPQAFFRERGNLEAWDLWQISKAIHNHEGTTPCLPWSAKEKHFAERHQRTKPAEDSP